MILQKRKSKFRAVPEWLLRDHSGRFGVFIDLLISNLKCCRVVASASWPMIVIAKIVNEFVRVHNEK